MNRNSIIMTAAGDFVLNRKPTTQQCARNKRRHREDRARACHGDELAQTLIYITREMVISRAFHLAERQCLKAHRHEWNEDDRQLYADTVKQLEPMIGQSTDVLFQ